MKYEYLIAYHFQMKGCISFSVGNTCIKRKKKVKSIEDVRKIAEFIESSIEGASNLGISNIVYLGRCRRRDS